MEHLEVLRQVQLAAVEAEYAELLAERNELYKSLSDAHADYRLGRAKTKRTVNIYERCYATLHNSAAFQAYDAARNALRATGPLLSITQDSRGVVRYSAIYRNAAK